MRRFNLKDIKNYNAKFSLSDKEIAGYITMTHIDKLLDEKVKCQRYICLLNIIRFVTEQITEEDYETMLYKFDIDSKTEEDVYNMYIEHVSRNNICGLLQDKIIGLGHVFNYKTPQREIFV